MRKDFITLALSIKRQFEERFDKKILKDFYVYRVLPELMEEWKQPELSNVDTDIGLAGMKTFDSGSDKDNQLLDDIVELSWLYRMRSKDERFPARLGPKGKKNSQH